MTPTPEWHAADTLRDEVAGLRRGHQELVKQSRRLIRERNELRATVARVRSVCMNTDGDYLDGDCDIPVGEVLRMLDGDGLAGGVAADAWDEGWATCGDWWHANAIGESHTVDPTNPYRAAAIREGGA